ncbi:MAG: hypothetical protein ACYTDW_09325 [Planctomycetota bacterium]|jgi:hypothetical protein
MTEYLYSVELTRQGRACGVQLHRRDGGVVGGATGQETCDHLHRSRAAAIKCADRYGWITAERRAEESE